MNNTKLCPNCKKENKADEKICVYCGALLIGVMSTQTTMHVPEEPIKIPAHERAMRMTRLYTDTLALLLVDHEEPILVKSTAKVVLGRQIPGDVAPTVDLNPYNASLLGVSRQHAIITRTANTYVLEDLGSTNGTWVNEARLAPRMPYDLQSGNLIRLGQLAFYVFFQLESAMPEASVETIVLKNGVAENGKVKLTPHILTSQLAPYLTAVAGVQTILHDILGRKPSDAVLLSILFDENSSTISVKLDGVPEAARFMKRQFPAWWDKYVSKLKATNVTDVETIKQAQPNSADPDATQPSAMHESELELATTFLHEWMPDGASDERQRYLDRLLPYLHTLLFSPLKIASDQPVDQATPQPLPT